MNLITIFLTGLFTGGLTCLAVQGGLLTTTLAQRSQDRAEQTLSRAATIIPLTLFLVAKIIAYTILGALLGYFGSFFQFSLLMRAIMQGAVALFMLGTALNLLEVHPIFRYFALTPPRFLMRMIRHNSKSSSYFTPLTLGAATIFIPCGTTQAMMALAIGSGNPLLGGAILASFTIGTSPLFFILGYLATQIQERWHTYFTRFAAALLIFISLFSIDSALALADSPLVPSKLLRQTYCTISFCSNENSVLAAVDNQQLQSAATITFRPNGYTPKSFAVKAGSKVTLNLVNQDGAGCVQAFTIPKLGIQKVVPVGATQTVSFTAPKKPGTLSFMCSMGMYQGTINVL